jgi:hypothetical protein
VDFVDNILGIKSVCLKVCTQSNGQVDIFAGCMADGERRNTLQKM